MGIPKRQIEAIPAPGPSGTGGPTDRAFFGHPRGLATLFFTELWERFSYYGMRALLVLYMTASTERNGLGFDAAKAGAIYGLYTAAVYLTAMPGGWIADRFIGQRRAVLVGGIVIALGHFTMAFSGMSMFYLGLLLIVLGTGLLKPNISTMVGGLYGPTDARRDAGFSIFYMGINMGAFIAPLVTGYLGEKVNWHLGFAAAGVGMVFGILQYALGGKHLGQTGLVASSKAGATTSGAKSGALVAVFAAGFLAVLAGLHFAGVIDLTSAQGLANATGVIIVSLAALYFGYLLGGKSLTGPEKKRVGVIAILFVFSAIFWSGFEQAGSSLNLFAERLTDRVLFGWEMPASYLQSVNALLIIGLAPVFAWVWLTLARRKVEPSSPAKFTFGLVFLGLGFLVMIAGSVAAASGEKVSPLWLVLTFLLHTIGELALSPVGLSTVTKLAPQRMAGQVMGVWFMSVSLGNLMAGLVAGKFEQFPLPQLFGAVGATAIGAGLVLGLLVKPIQRMLGARAQPS
jgi:proton-dependent oligopeptide transporter, POT family